MNNLNKVEITNRQLMFSLISILAGASLLSLPRLVASEAGQDAWISIIIGALAPLLILLTAVFLFRRFPGYTFHQICNSVLGKYISRIPLAIYVIYSILFSSVIIRNLGDMLDTYILPRTPRYVQLIFLLLVGLYIILSGIKVIARFNELTFFVFLALLFFLLPSLREAQWTFMLPIAAAPVMKLLSGGRATAMAFTGMEYLFVLYPFVRDKKKVVKNSVFALVIVAAAYLYSTLICIVVFGPYSIKHHIWPVLVLLKITEVPVLERLEFFFILLYIAIIFRPIMNQLFASRYFASQLFGIKEFRRTVVPVIAIVYILSLIPANIVETFKYSDFVGILGMAVGISLPATLLLLSIVFKKGANSNDQG